MQLVQIGWLALSTDNKWDGVSLTLGDNIRPTLGKFGILGTSVLHLGKLGEMRIYRAKFYNIALSPNDSEKGIAYSTHVRFDPEFEVTKAHGSDPIRYWIEDRELLSWKDSWGVSIAHAQVDAGWPLELVPTEFFDIKSTHGWTLAHKFADARGVVPEGTADWKDHSGLSVEQVAKRRIDIQTRQDKVNGTMQDSK